MCATSRTTDSAAQSHDVDKVLSELGIDADDPRLIEVWNKIDCLDAEERARLANLAERQPAERRAGAGLGADRGGDRAPHRGDRSAPGRHAGRRLSSRSIPPTAPA